MSKFSLFQRFIEQGTVSEPDGIPNPLYALPSTVNWMRAYAILIEDEELDFQSAKNFYKSVQPRKMSPSEENSVFEHLLLALHQLSALQALAEVPCQADIARVASVAWYYGIYAAVSAMIAANDGSVQDNHTKTANTWDRQFGQNSLIPHPFDLRVTTLVKADADIQIDAIRKGPKINLVNTPTTPSEAHQAICGYLSGTRNWWQWKTELDIRRDKAFKDLDVTDFRTKKARTLRDERLKKQCISFMHQAFRFRGKANYREALYLAHGKTVEGNISTFVPDMAKILEAFTAMAGAYCFKRLGKELQDSFLADLDKHRSFSLDPRDIWS
jgi:hypothetical protein